MQRVSRSIILSCLAVSLGACALSQPPVTMAPPLPATAPLSCTENPEGLDLRVHPLGSSRVRVSGEGFLPGEKLLLVFSTETDTLSGRKGVRLEARPAQAVSSDGTFTFEETLQPLNGETLWTLAVLHQRGTACLRFAAP